MKTYDELLADGDALLAQVDLLLDAIKPFATSGVCNAIAREDYSIMHERIKDWHGVSEFKKAQDAYNATPHQCLAEIKAEAGRAGFVECIKFVRLGIEPNSDHANQYAAKVRQGGAV